VNKYLKCEKPKLRRPMCLKKLEKVVYLPQIQTQVVLNHQCFDMQFGETDSPEYQVLLKRLYNNNRV
jgi:hypothetical protein